MNNRFKYFLVLGLGTFSFLFYIFIVDNFINFLIKKKIKLEEYNYLNNLEDKFCDLLINLKLFNKFKIINKKISSDIIILKIDNKNFKRNSNQSNMKLELSDLIDKITNLKKSINTLYLDIPFTELNINNSSDDIFLKSLNRNNKIVINYSSMNRLKSREEDSIIFKRMDYIKNKFGVLNKIRGTVDSAYSIQNTSLLSIQLMEKVNDTGCSDIIHDSDKIVRKTPLVIKYVEKEGIKFTEIKSGDFINNILIDGYRIANKGNDYELKRYYPVLYDINKSKGRILSNNDLYLIKSKIDEYKNNLDLDIETLKGKIEKTNREIIDKIFKHLNTGFMKEEMQDEIKTILNDKNNQKDIDIIIDRLERNFESFAQKDKKWNGEVAFFKKMKNQCININRAGKYQDINNNYISLSLYDVLYNNKKIYYDKIYSLKEYFVMSIPLILISRYYNVDINNIEVIYGKKILLKNPMLYNKITKRFEELKINNKVYKVLSIPIDKHGFLKINYSDKFNTVETKNNASSVYNYNDVLLDKQIDFENKILIMGVLSPDIKDNFYKTSFKDMPDIEIIANTVNTILTNSFIKTLPDYLSILILLLISIIISIIALNKNLFLAFIYLIVFIFSYFIFTIILFIMVYVVLDFIKMIIISGISFFIMIFYRKIFLHTKNS